MSNKIKGDVVELVEHLKEKHPGHTLVLVHGCNCMNNMGAGLAKSIAKEWPLADVVDKDTQKGDKSKLGRYSIAHVDPKFSIVNLYTQYRYGGGVNVDYFALRVGLNVMVKSISEHAEHVIFLVPEYIGCGLAGGDIKIVAPILEKVLSKHQHYLFSI